VGATASITQLASNLTPRTSVACFRSGKGVSDFVEKNLFHLILRVGQAEVLGEGDSVLVVVALAKSGFGSIPAEMPARTQPVRHKEFCRS
jgi:hypothetical protein